MTNQLKAKFRGQSNDGSQFKVSPADLKPDIWYQINISPVPDALRDDPEDYEQYLQMITQFIQRMKDLLRSTYEGFEIKLYFDSTMATGRFHWHGVIMVKKLLFTQYWLLHKLNCHFYIDTIDDMDKRVKYMEKFIPHLQQEGINGVIDNIPPKEIVQPVRKIKKVPARTNRYGL